MEEIKPGLTSSFFLPNIYLFIYAENFFFSRQITNTRPFLCYKDLDHAWFLLYKYLDHTCCGDQLLLEVPFRLNGLGLWPNDPVRERRRIRRQSTKIEIEIALPEKLKGIYNRPKPIRGEKPPRNFCPW